MENSGGGGGKGDTAEDHRACKEEGNSHFKSGRFDEALACYTKALTLAAKPGSGCQDSETAVYLKNRAATYLKLQRYTDCVTDTDKALELAPNDPKALFRRCQAKEELGKHEDAYKDAMSIIKVDPKNRAVQPILNRLNPIIQRKLADQNSTNNQVQQMLDLTFSDEAADSEKRKQAASNLIVLAREDAGAQMIYTSGGVEKLVKLIEIKDHNLKLTAIRVLACIAKGSNTRARAVLDTLTIKRLGFLIAEPNDEVSTAASHLVQTVIVSVTDIDTIRAERDKYETDRQADIAARRPPYPHVATKIAPPAMEYVDMIFVALTYSINQGKVSKFGRDNVMELIIKFLPKKSGVGWAKKFITEKGIIKLLEVAGTIAEHKTIPVSANSRMHASLALSKVYDDLDTDKDREDYREQVDEYFKDMFGDALMESKLEAIMALAALLQGPYEVGNSILGKEGIMEMLLAMANSGDAIHTKYAVEALVHSANKKDRCSGVIKQATPILKELYQSSNDYIKVRALVGLCKLGSFGGADASAKSFADGSTETLSKACRKFLKNPTKDADLRKWAAEGLAYLSLDADVKEQLVEDKQSLLSLIDLAKQSDKGVLYPVASILVNVTNSFDKKEIEPELLELAKFSKHHIPEDHEKDGEKYVEERINKVVAAGVVPALVALTKTDSENCKELLSRVFQAVCCNVAHRGLVIQQGGAKVLIPLALENTEQGKLKAAQALAKIAITNDPKIAFPGQRSYEVVRPIIQLLQIDRTAIENYEALLALTNLASSSESIRKRILKEKGFGKIEHYCYEEHADLRRGATECLCNLVLSEEAAEPFEGENDRVKMMMLFCGEEDLGLVNAAAGCLAILSCNEKICKKIVTCTTQWFDILKELCTHEVPPIQHRGVHIIMNLIAADKEIAKQIIDSPYLELLVAISMLDDPARAESSRAATQALEHAVQHELIKPSQAMGKK